MAETDREAIEIACRMAVAEESESIRIVQIANTKQINRISYHPLTCPKSIGDNLVIDGQPESMTFDDEGNQLCRQAENDTALRSSILKPLKRFVFGDAGSNV